jgi:hypothetical protein
MQVGAVTKLAIVCGILHGRYPLWQVRSAAKLKLLHESGCTCFNSGLLQRRRSPAIKFRGPKKRKYAFVILLEESKLLVEIYIFYDDLFNHPRLLTII